MENLKKKNTPDDATNVHTNGHANVHTNGNANGSANGHVNGHTSVNTNGHTNGKINGHNEKERKSPWKPIILSNVTNKDTKADTLHKEAVVSWTCFVLRS